MFLCSMTGLLSAKELFVLAGAASKKTGGFLWDDCFRPCGNLRIYVVLSLFKMTLIIGNNSRKLSEHDARLLIE